MKKRIREGGAMQALPSPAGLSKDVIEKIAEQVATGVGFKPQDDIASLVQKLGGRISVKDFWSLDGVTDESIIVEADGAFEIFVPPHTTPERDRFTIAHELGHYVLHYVMQGKKQQAGGKFTASRYGNDRAEWEANWFAAGFLMPRKSFISKYKECKSIGRVAEAFSVSTAAAYVRARTLGLVSDDTP